MDEESIRKQFGLLPRCEGCDYIGPLEEVEILIIGDDEIEAYELEWDFVRDSLE